MIFFLDTSALIKLYHHERGTDSFTNYLLEITGDVFVTISEITKIEVHSSLLKKYREKQISYKNLLQVFSVLENDFMKMKIINLDYNIKNISIAIIDSFGMKYSIKTLDSLQLASAIYLNNISKINYFISSDKKLLNLAKELFPIINPENL